MPVNRIVLFIAAALALAGTASAFAVGAPEATTSLSSSAGGNRASLSDDLPDLDVPDALEPTSTTTLPTVTTAPTTSTTVHQHLDTVVTQPPTTMSPVATTTPPTTTPSNKATIYVKNNFSSPVKIAINDVNSKEWTLAPGESAGPFTLITATDHGDGMTVTATDTQCGYGDGEDYFHGGQTYVLTAYKSTQKCGEIDGPALEVHNTTANSYWYFGDPGRMPRTG